MSFCFSVVSFAGPNATWAVSRLKIRENIDVRKGSGLDYHNLRTIKTNNCQINQQSNDCCIISNLLKRDKNGDKKMDGQRIRQQLNVHRSFHSSAHALRASVV